MYGQVIYGKTIDNIPFTLSAGVLSMVKQCSIKLFLLALRSAHGGVLP